MRYKAVLQNIEKKLGENKQFAIPMYDAIVGYLKAYGVKKPEDMMLASTTLTNNLVDLVSTHILNNPELTSFSHPELKYALHGNPELVKLNDMLKSSNENVLHTNFPNIRELLALSAVADVMLKSEKDGIKITDTAMQTKFDAMAGKVYPPYMDDASNFVKAMEEQFVKPELVNKKSAVKTLKTETSKPTLGRA